MFKKILLAASPRVDSRTAPETAFNLARKHDAELVLFHALPFGCDAWCPIEETVSGKSLRECAESRIRDFFAGELESVPAHSIRVAAGTAHEQLLNMVHAEGIDLIVMGHHTGDMDRPDRMWGSVDTTIHKVCANVFSPILVVTDPTPAQCEYKRIVMATDFSTPSDSALCYAIGLARQLEAHLDVFHVLDIGQHRPNPKYYMKDMDTFIDKAMERMERHYASALKGVSHSFTCWEGVPYVEILKQARWNEADLVIMAQTSSSDPISKPVVGSTSIQVALSPGCPVLIVNYRPRNCMA